jgi:hypothetical protein
MAVGAQETPLVSKPSNVTDILSVACSPCRIGRKWPRLPGRMSSYTQSVRIPSHAPRRYPCHAMRYPSQSPVGVQCLTYSVHVAATDSLWTFDTFGSYQGPERPHPEPERQSFALPACWPRGRMGFWTLAAISICEPAERIPERCPYTFVRFLHPSCRLGLRAHPVHRELRPGVAMRAGIVFEVILKT